ncbi:DUF930 domain-containing protein [Agrobacterium sp. AGB01]|uniref:DUF930 domain-containing protein n=1 Tax=Agrobacterium sp. AGB01 TaxID=2769302 RepID=UPI001AED9F34|nr:DUF930 domain-containing protein [Agrobacterium sp. AGB01]
MQKISDKQWWQKGWTIPVSVVLHLAIVGAFFLQFPDFPTEMAEPESISVDLVPPEPEPPPPPPEPEQKQPEEQAPPPPPPAEEAAQNLPLAALPDIPIRPEPQQTDVMDNPGISPEDEASVSEDPAQPEEKPTTEPNEKPVETADAKTAPAAAKDNPPPTAADAELAPPDPVKAEDPKKAEEVKPQEKPVEQKSAAAPPTTDAPKKLKSAKKLLSGQTIKDPAVRSMLGDLPPKRRIAQMCSIEALAQIRETRADSDGLRGVVPNSEKGRVITGNVLEASGGAFNINNRWYDITFQCEVDLDNFKVTSFRFDIGKTAVPQADAVKRGLSVY